VLDRDVAERMATELPRGRLVEIPRAVHTLHEDDPEAVPCGGLRGEITEEGAKVQEVWCPAEFDHLWPVEVSQ